MYFILVQLTIASLKIEKKNKPGSHQGDRMQLATRNGLVVCVSRNQFK